MAKYSVTPTNEEITFAHDEIIVSKTDLKGHLTYTNDVFCRVAEMSTNEVLGAPHSIIRHPDMPRAVFKLLWETIEQGKEIFAYVKNMSKTGKYYWVIAHVTPSFDSSGRVNGYHSNRRSPTKHSVAAVSGLYSTLLAEENKHSNAKAGLEASYSLLEKTLADASLTYSEFVWAMGD